MFIFVILPTIITAVINISYYQIKWIGLIYTHVKEIIFKIELYTMLIS